MLLNSAPVRPDAGVVAEARVVVPIGRVGEGAFQSGAGRKFNIYLPNLFLNLYVNPIWTLKPHVTSSTPSC